MRVTILRLTLISCMFLITACDATATSRVSSPDLAEQVQANQYYRDAAATSTSAAIELERNMNNIRATAQAATQEEIYVRETQFARATQGALNVQGTSMAQAAQSTSAALEASIRATEAAHNMSIIQAKETAHVISTATAFSQTATPLAATQMAIVLGVEQDERRAYWAQVTDPIVAIMPTTLLFTFLILLVVGAVLAYRRLMPVLELRARAIARGPHDAPLLLFDGLVVDPDRSFGPALLVDPNGAQSTGHAPTLDLQAGVTMRDQAVDLVRGLPRLERERKRAERLVTNVASAQPESPQMEMGENLPSLAPWGMLRTWQGGGLPLGLGQSGLILADPEANAHLLMAGTTGSGKTRYGLRPVISGALAEGWQVVIFDRSGLDFLPFQNHPNAQLIILDEAREAIGYLKAMYAEIQRRFVILREEGVSTWGRLPSQSVSNPRVLTVFDEFSNMSDALQKREREELWRGARMVAAEGRKAGVHLALSLQDPTHKSIDLRIRRNCVPIAFRVRDDAASRVVLGKGGAENLPDRQFFALLNGANMVRGVAFAPGDQEISGFLETHPVNALPAPLWLQEGVERTAEKTSVEQNQTEAQVLAHLDDYHAARISMRQIEQQVFGYTGGKAHETVKTILQGTLQSRLEIVTATTTEGSDVSSQ